MPTTLTGSGATDPTTSPTLSAPASGDPIASGPMDTALQALLNDIAWLRANGAWLGLSDTFTASVTFNAGVTFGALAIFNANLSLGANALQSLLKGGTGKLQVGTSQASDFELLANNAVRFAALAAGGLDAKSNALSNLGAPVATTDAMRYGDSFAAPTVTAPGLNANWTNGTQPPGYWKDRQGVVHLRGGVIAGTGAGNTAFVLPVGFRPTTLARNFPAWDSPGAAFVLGQVLNDGSVTFPGGVIATHTYVLDAFSFLAGD